MRSARFSRPAAALALVWLSAPPAFAQGDPGPMTIVDLIELPSLGDGRISPDGSRILYVRSEADWEKNRTVSHIWRIGVDGTGEVQMTNGEKDERSPRWSPDGSTIAFLTERGDDEHSQIWLIPNDGGEARRLTEHETGVSDIQWSPDGRWIYFTAKDPKTEEEKAREEIEDNVFRYDETTKNTHLWRVAVAGGEAERVTTGEFSLRGYELSRDGTKIAHHRAPGPLIDDGRLAEVWLMDADGRNARQITTNAIGERGAQLSPDHESVLFSANTNDTLDDFYYNPRLFVVPAAGGDPKPVVAGGEYSVGDATWAPDGESIYFTANTGVRQNLFRVRLADGEISPVTSGDHTVRGSHFSPAAGAFVLQASSPTDPGEIAVLSIGDGEMRRVTKVFADVTEKYRLPRVEAVRWQAEDGVTVEGLLIHPLDYQEGTRYPLVVQTHGGPASSDKFGFFRSHNYEPVLAAMGYFVFKPNYRGSTGYGDEFLRDMVGHYFHQAHKDVMTGVDALIERGLVDGDRMAKMGWSAGGHMTNKIITYTDRFKAASSGAGAVNWVSMYGQSDVRIYRTPWFGGTPWDADSPIEQYMTDSPLFQTHKVTTPTIVLVGQDDARVPMPQSVELYRALRHHGVPTHLYVAPKQGHGWRQLQQRLFKANVELDWFERWVRDRDYVWEKSPLHPEETEAAEASTDK